MPLFEAWNLTKSITRVRGLGLVLFVCALVVLVDSTKANSNRLPAVDDHSDGLVQSVDSRIVGESAAAEWWYKTARLPPSISGGLGPLAYEAPVGLSDTASTRTESGELELCSLNRSVHKSNGLISLALLEQYISAPPGDVWTLQVMPHGLLYRSYLAGVKEPRFSSTWTNENRLGEVWDSSLGGRLGLLRYGTCDPIHPEGWQIDVEGGIQAHIDPQEHSSALQSVDFRIGLPVTFARGPWQFKTGYAHISSHMGDEYLLMHPNARRINYTRDSILLGLGYFCTERLRLYVETACALSAGGGAEPWELQFGADWAPARNTGLLGAPFFACNGHVRQELDYGGNLVLQGGWAWRQSSRGALFRIGVQYYRGKSDQYEYFDVSEERFGWGMWADY